MAELYSTIADQHAAMADHYTDGAEGAHKDDVKKADDDFEPADELADPDRTAIAILKAAGAQAGSVAERLRFETEATLAEFEIQKAAVRTCRTRAELSDPSREAFVKLLRRSR